MTNITISTSLRKAAGHELKKKKRGTKKLEAI
jgi:hypothetical protein